LLLFVCGGVYIRFEIEESVLGKIRQILTKHITPLSERLDALERNINTRDPIITLNSTDPTLDSALAILNSNYHNLNNQVRIIDGKATYSHATVLDLKDKLTDLNDKVTNIDGKVTDLNNKVIIIDGKATTSHATALDLKDKVTDLTDKVTNIDTKATTSHATAVDLKDKVTDLNNKVTIIDSKMINSNGKVTDIDEKIANINPTVIVNTDDKFNNLENKVTTMEANIARMGTAIANLQSLQGGNPENSDLKKLIYGAASEKVDYAAVRNGAQIVAASPTYQPPPRGGPNIINLWGLFTYETVKEPVTMLQPSMDPGDCWPMKGKSGYAVIELARKIRIRTIGVEHLPSMKLTNKDSAPHEIHFTGYDDTEWHNAKAQERNPKGLDLGKLTYNIPGNAYQEILVNETSSISYLRVDIKSNYGHQNYTCIYSIRVYGEPKQGE